ncbi:MAG: hypothetical protein GY793_07420 [Proteobacteria bacterium]|nr:hypothetical protein [Pseudomonadota bacterium]
MMSVIPFVGYWIVIQIWGGPTISQSTIKRFLILHFLSPLIVLIVSFVHIQLLHRTGSLAQSKFKSSTIGLSCVDLTSLTPYFLVKDWLILQWLLITYVILIAYYPRLTDNH